MSENVMISLTVFFFCWCHIMSQKCDLKIPLIVNSITWIILFIKPTHFIDPWNTLNYQVSFYVVTLFLLNSDASSITVERVNLCLRLIQIEILIRHFSSTLFTALTIELKGNITILAIWFEYRFATIWATGS